MTRYSGLLGYCYVSLTKTPLHTSIPLNTPPLFGRPRPTRSCGPSHFCKDLVHGRTNPFPTTCILEGTLSSPFPSHVHRNWNGSPVKESSEIWEVLYCFLSTVRLESVRLTFLDGGEFLTIKTNSITMKVKDCWYWFTGRKVAGSGVFRYKVSP